MSALALPLAARRKPWVLGVLAVSLVLNAFLIGAVATDFLRFSGGRGGPPVSFELRWLRGKLPDEGMARVEAAVNAARPSTARRFDHMRSLRLEIGKLATAPVPDRAAIDARLAEIRSELDEIQTEAQRASMDALLTLPVEMRQRLGDETRAP